MPLKYNKLRGRIVERYGTISNFSSELGTSIQVVSRKLSGKVQFSRKDIEIWCNLLGLQLEEIGPYFFA